MPIQEIAQLNQEASQDAKSGPCLRYVRQSWKQSLLSIDCNPGHARVETLEGFEPWVSYEHGNMPKRSWT